MDHNSRKSQPYWLIDLTESHISVSVNLLSWEEHVLLWRSHCWDIQAFMARVHRTLKTLQYSKILPERPVLGRRDRRWVTRPLYGGPQALSPIESSLKSGREPSLQTP